MFCKVLGCVLCLLPACNRRLWVKKGCQKNPIGKGKIDQNLWSPRVFFLTHSQKQGACKRVPGRIGFHVEMLDLLDEQNRSITVGFIVIVFNTVTVVTPSHRRQAWLAWLAWLQAHLPSEFGLIEIEQGTDTCWLRVSLFLQSKSRAITNKHRPGSQKSLMVYATLADRQILGLNGIFAIRTPAALGTE